MKILVIGSGGREHALVWKLSKSTRVEKIYCAPGNAGIAEHAEIIDISATALDSLLKFAKDHAIDYTVVGPEAPLAAGIVDQFEAAGLKIFGPNKAAAQLESSKSFTRDFCRRHQIPQADYATFTDVGAANDYLEQRQRAVVIKADGLAAGKGVYICPTLNEAKSAVSALLQEQSMGEAGKKIVIEDFLPGEEASFIALVDGDYVLPLASSQDHKRLFDGDQGPNTGGMGAYSPAPIVDDQMREKIMQEIMQPTLDGLKAEGITFKGVLYAGVMISNNQPFLLEFNVRFGDPECQPLMMRLQTDLLKLIEATLTGNLKPMVMMWDARPAACVVMAQEGYPEAYAKGKVISGLEDAKKMTQCQVFHAGTLLSGGKYITNGGRVLGVTALGDDLALAVKNAYQGVQSIHWDGAFYRSDIAAKGMTR